MVEFWFPVERTWASAVQVAAGAAASILVIACCNAAAGLTVGCCVCYGVRANTRVYIKAAKKVKAS